MKKIIALLLAVAMFTACYAAMAETGNTENRSRYITFTAEHAPEGSGFGGEIAEKENRDETLLEKRDGQLEVLAETTVPEYFAPGAEVEYTMKLVTLGADENSQVYEFFPVIVDKYDPNYGKVRVVYKDETPFPTGKPIPVMTGYYTDDAKTKVKWNTYEGEPQEDGTLVWYLDPEMVSNIQRSTGLVALIKQRKPEEPEPTATPAPSPAPSKTTNDIQRVVTETENGPVDSDFYVEVIMDDKREEELLAASQVQLLKLGDQGVTAYFAPGHEEEFKQKLNAMGVKEPLTVYEFWPVVAENYDPAYGKVRMEYQTATLYPEGEPVGVMIGFYKDDSLTDVEWTMYEGQGQANGAVAWKLEPDAVLRIQNETALVAFVSNDLYNQ